jgi:hypothetical protein
MNQQRWGLDLPTLFCYTTSMSDLITRIRDRFDHEAQKKILREKYQAKMLFGFNGGMFRAAPEMISFLSLYGNESIVIQDVYENPVEINAQELCDQMRLRMQEQMNAWLTEWEQLRKQR